MVEYRDRQTRQRRWERPDEDITYDAKELDRRVVAKDQIRTIIRTFRDRLFTDIFPRRREVPKTLIFAKDDSHAETSSESCATSSVGATPSVRRSPTRCLGAQLH